MAITLRNTKGLPLTHVELDGNFTDLNTRITALEGAADSDNQTLTLVGNTLSISGGNSVTLIIPPTGDLTGSVFADDSTLLVDGVAGKIVGDVENASINTQAIRSSDTGTGNLLLQGSSTDAGDGGSIIIWGGSGFGTGNGGFVTIDAGNASGSGTKGEINIGQSSGNVRIDSGSANNLLLSSVSGALSIGRVGGEIDIYGGVEFNNGTTAFQPGNSVTFNSSVDFNGVVNFDDATIDWAAIVGGAIQNNGLPVLPTQTLDISGSVFADDSTLLVDGVNGRLVGPLLTNSIASPATGNLELDVGRENGGAFIVTAWEDRNDPEGGWKQILWGYDGSKYDFFVGGDITAQGTINTTNISHPSNDGLGLRLNFTDQSTLMVAKQSFDRTFDETFGAGYNFSILNTPNRVRVTFDANSGLYLKGLIERWTTLYENIRFGDPYSFEFDYSNIRLSLEPDLYDIVTNVVDVIQFDELIWDIEIDQDPIAVLAAAGKAPGELDQISLRYDYNNTAGFDIGRNRYGMSVDDDDIDLRAGKDIDLDAVDDFRVVAGSAFNMSLERNNGQDPDAGININLRNNWNTALEDVKTWTFGFDGNLYLPETDPSLISNSDINITSGSNYTWNFGNDGTFTVAASSIGGGLGLIYSPADKSLWLSGTNVDKTTDGNGVVLNGGQNDGTGRGGGISLFGGNSTGGTGGSIFIETGIGQSGADNGVISIGTAYAKTITIGNANQSSNEFYGTLYGNVEGVVTASTGSQFSVSEDYFGNTTHNGSASGISLTNTSLNQTIQVGWTAEFANVTHTVQSVSLIGDRLFISMNDGISFLGALPVTFTSPDYTAGSADPVTITANSNDWVFGTDGTTTFPGGITFNGTLDFANAGSIQNFAPGDIYAKAGQYLYVKSIRPGGGTTTNAAFIYDTNIGNVSQTFYGKTQFANNGQAPIVDFTGATVTGLPSSSYSDTDVAIYLNGNLDTSIIPDTNSTYDIGSAEFKIRHFYLSNNSMKFVDDTDPLNPVEYSLGVTNDYRLQYNGASIKDSSYADSLLTGATIDITKTNHFVTQGYTYTLPNGTYIGQEIHFWINAQDGSPTTINVSLAKWMPGVNLSSGPLAWQLNTNEGAHHQCIWDGTAWVIAGQPGGV